MSQCRKRQHNTSVHRNAAVSTVNTRLAGVSDVIVGGTRADGDWFPHPRAATTEDILRRGLALCPELSPHYATNPQAKPTIDDVRPIIVEEGCGLRPGRKGGIRLEKGVIETPSGLKVPVVYNYGYGSTRSMLRSTHDFLDMEVTAISPRGDRLP